MGIKKVLFLQKVFFEKKGIRNIYIVFSIIFCIGYFLFENNLVICFNNSEVLDKLNNNLFSISGVIAGLIFTSMGVISSSNNSKISNLKTTKNFSLLGNYFNNAISKYIIVVLISLIDIFITSKKILFCIFIIKLYFFIIATIFFLISVYFTKAILFVDE